MARITMHEGQGQTRRRLSAPHLHLDKIADPHPEHIAIEMETLGGVIDAHHKMSETHLAGFKTTDRSRRMERLLEVHQRTTTGLARNPARILKLDQIDDTARLRKLLRTGDRFKADGLQLRRQI